MESQNEWTPPEKPGLKNREPILPIYYLKTIINEIDGREEEIKIIKIKYIDVIKDDITPFNISNADFLLPIFCTTK